MAGELVLIWAPEVAMRTQLQTLLGTGTPWKTLAPELDGGSTIAAHAGDGCNVIVATSSSRLDDALVEQLRSRPSTTALVVIGSNPCPMARPTIWLPELPAAPLLTSIVRHHMPPQRAVGTTPPTWRRKGDMIIGQSAPVRTLLQALDRLAPAQTPVIITGESGVGKELVARALHYGSARSKHGFIVINCAAVPENLFEAELFGYERGAFTGADRAHVGAVEAASKGTLFLDEIGEMPLSMQAKLLRVLESSEVMRIGTTEARKVEFRLVSATNRDLQAEVAAGRFREDLYYRIQVYPIHVVPLRERIEDVPALATHYLSIIGERDHRPDLHLSARAVDRLLSYTWPGNVRELVNMLERAVLLAGSSMIEDEHILTPKTAPTSAPTRSKPSSVSPYREAKRQFETDYYGALVNAAGGNITRAARLGQKTRKEVYDALKRLGLPVGDFRGDED
jgi:transcriptional regulator with GAF, ATPase, and Fis domain